MPARRGALRRHPLWLVGALARPGRGRGCAPALARALYPGGGVCTGRRVSMQRIVPGATPRARPKRLSPGPRWECSEMASASAAAASPSRNPSSPEPRELVCAHAADESRVASSWRRRRAGHLVGIPSPSLAISDAVVTPLNGVLRQQVLYLSLSPSYTLFCVVLSPFGKLLPS
jgi:hypothetical protein